MVQERCQLVGSTLAPYFNALKGNLIFKLQTDYEEDKLLK